MRSRYRQIWNLYAGNTMFALLASFIIGSAIVSKAFFILGNPYFGDDFATLLFVATLWLTFYLGLMVKRQFASHRAALLPGYRAPHILFLAGIYVFFLAAAVAWAYTLRPYIMITRDGLHGIYVCCFLASLLILYLGYLSIRRVFLYSYAGVLLIAVNSTHLITAFETVPVLNHVITAVSVVLIALFLRRLATLQEHHFEYPYLLSWPAKDYFRGQLKSKSFENPLEKWLKIEKRPAQVPSYHRAGSLFERAYHWDYTEHADIKVLTVFIIMATPVYLLFIKNNPMFADFFKNAYSNFLLLSITPVLVTVGSHYEKLAYWGYDLLRPVTREQYMLERGVMLVTHLIAYWLIFTVCFALLPVMIFNPAVFVKAKFWGFIVLTGNFALLTTACLAWLSCFSDSKAVIFCGLVLCNIVLFQFYFAAAFPLPVILWTNAICFLAGAAMFRLAYRAWCRKEYV